MKIWEFELARSYYLFFNTLISVLVLLCDLEYLIYEKNKFTLENDILFSAVNYAAINNKNRPPKDIRAQALRLKITKLNPIEFVVSNWAEEISTYRPN